MFIRHGHSVRKAGYYDHENEVLLSAEGMQQAKRVQACFAAFQPDYIVTSPLPRCMQTTDIVIDGYGQQAIHDPRLKERSFASLFNKSFDEIKSSYGQEFLSDLVQCSENINVDKEESIREAQARVVESVIEHLKQTTARIAIVSHGGPHSWLVCHFLGLPLQNIRKFSLGEAHYSLFECEDHGLKRIISLNTIQDPRILLKNSPQ